MFGKAYVAKKRAHANCILRGLTSNGDQEKIYLGFFIGNGRPYLTDTPLLNIWIL